MIIIITMTNLDLSHHYYRRHHHHRQRSLEVVNRDRFTQRLSVFRLSVRQWINL